MAMDLSLLKSALPVAVKGIESIKRMFSLLGIQNFGNPEEQRASRTSAALKPLLV